MPSETKSITGLNKRQTAEAVQRARALGMSLDDYIQHLIEEDLRISDDAKSKTFAQLIPPDTRADDSEIDRLVERAKDRFHRRKTLSKR